MPLGRSGRDYGTTGEDLKADFHLLLQVPVQGPGAEQEDPGGRAEPQEAGGQGAHADPGLRAAGGAAAAAAAGGPQARGRGEARRVPPPATAHTPPGGGGGE